MIRFHDHRLATAAVLLALGTGALTGCGGDDEKDSAKAESPVATVSVPGGEAITITRADYGRFYTAAVALAENRDAANIVPLEGPEYTACVAEDKKLPANKGKTPQALKTACAAKADSARENAVAQAVNLRWILAEAEAQGLSMTDAEVAAKGKELDATLDKTGGKAAFLKRTGFTQADLDLNARSGVAQEKLIDKATQGKKGAALTEAKSAFSTAFFARWKARTSCSAGFESPTVCGKTAPKQS